MPRIDGVAWSAAQSLMLRSPSRHWKMGFKAKFSNGGFKYEVPQEKKLGVKSRLVINTFYAGTAVAIPNITALDYLRLRILTNTASI